MSSKRVRRYGFTLVELLVVIGIIAILISLLLPALNKARDSAKTVACASNMRQLGIWLQLYRNDYNDFVPALNGSSTSYPSDNAINASNYAPNKYTGGFNPQLQAYMAKLPGGEKYNFKQEIYLCPAAIDPYQIIENGDERLVSYAPVGPQWYNQDFVPGNDGEGRSKSTRRALRFNRIEFRDTFSKRSPSQIVQMGETVGNYGSIWLGDMSTRLPATPADANQRYYGTNLRWTIQLRHNKNRGMNLLFWDGHAVSVPNFIDMYYNQTEAGADADSLSQYVYEKQRK